MGKHLTYSNVVSTLCLFILLGGVAVAATQLPKNSVGGKQLKKNAVNGAKVANGSLSAADIGGPVDSAKTATEAAHAASADRAGSAASAADATHAASADQAANAASLGGTPAAGFLASDRVRRVDLEVEETTAGTHDYPLLSLGPLDIVLSCNIGASTTLGLTAASTAPGAKIYAGFNTSDPSASGNVFNFSSGETNFFTRTDGSVGEAGTGEMVYRDDETTISMTFGYAVNDLFQTCDFAGLATRG